MAADHPACALVYSAYKSTISNDSSDEPNRLKPKRNNTPLPPTRAVPLLPPGMMQNIAQYVNLVRWRHRQVLSCSGDDVVFDFSDALLEAGL